MRRVDRSYPFGAWRCVRRCCSEALFQSHSLAGHIVMADAVSSRPLTRGDAKTLALASLGGALEFYDFIIYVFFAVVIGKLFFPPDMPEWLEQLQTFGIFAAGYLARPLG